MRLTPKPGLVDEHNNGAHSDMDLSLFLRSIDALTPWFRQITALSLCGADAAALQAAGREAEAAMFCATGGVNTHKGALFSFSVLLAALAASEGCELLAVHDGARPLILPEQVDDMVRLGQRTYAAAPALPVTDTVKVADMAGLVQSTPDRKTLYAVQTPQVFQANILKAALQSAIQAGADITDDCSAVERLGKEVWLAPGWRENIKITTREDLTMAEAFLRERENRA